MKDNREVESIVHTAVLAVMSEKGLQGHAVANTDHVVATLGFSSLDLAVLLAQLEIALEGDPFAELISVTTVRTVGDICDAYCRFFAGEQPSTELEDRAFDRAQRRVQTERGK